jgi:outer membrane protein assembly factor BamB
MIVNRSHIGTKSGFSGRIAGIISFMFLCLLFFAMTWLTAPRIEVIIGTFLGNWQRNYYGNRAPEKLDVIWRTYLGKGTTIISKKIGEKEWAGSGWTGQPLLIKENGKLILFQGAFDHHLKKIDAETGRVIWEYAFDDVIKGTATIWLNPGAVNDAERIVLLQGSRRGIDKDLYSRIVPSFRGISGISGQEFWRLNIRQTPSYSRDVDGSALVLGDTAYIGLENALFVKFDPDPQKTIMKDGLKQPAVFQETKLYSNRDIRDHGGNLVTESSPALIGDHIYITAGSGHVYGYDLKTGVIDWDFYIGSDMDGSPVVTDDSCLIVTVEKQYIPGNGGVFKLDPRKDPSESVVWFMPTENDSVVSWAGGVIGSACINDRTRVPTDPYLCAFIAIDGNLYVVDHRKVDTTQPMVYGPDGKHLYHPPALVYRKKTGPSIATPIIVGDKIIAPGYKGIYLFEFTRNGVFRLLDKHLSGAIESTPIVYNERLYVGSRDGYLYCLGGKK